VLLFYRPDRASGLRPTASGDLVERAPQKCDIVPRTPARIRRLRGRWQGTDLRRMALALKGTTEGPHFDRAAFKVARIYVTLAADGRTANFKFMPDEQQFKCIMARDAFAPIPNAWGRQGLDHGHLAQAQRGGTQERTRNGVGARAEEAQAAMSTKGTAWSCAEGHYGISDRGRVVTPA
jgi:hypothetical protein